MSILPSSPAVREKRSHFEVKSVVELGGTAEPSTWRSAKWTGVIAAVSTASPASGEEHALHRTVQHSLAGAIISDMLLDRATNDRQGVIRAHCPSAAILWNCRRPN